MTTLPTTAPTFHQGEQLRAYLNSYGISAQELANRLGKQSLSAIYYHLKQPQLAPNTQVALLRVLGPSVMPFLEHAQSVDVHHHGQQLRAYLERMGIAQQELARQLGRPKSTMAGYLNSEKIGQTVRRAIAQALGVTEGELFGMRAVTPADEVATLPPASSPSELLGRQRAEWQDLLSRLTAMGAPESELSLCQYQLYHLRLSQSALAAGETAGT